MKSVSLQTLARIGGGYYFPGNVLPNGKPVNPYARVLLG